MMKKIGLLSDTHSYLDPKVLEYFDSVDEIWHAGDIGDPNIIDQLKEVKPVRAVFGNIDGQPLRSEWPEDDRFEVEGLDVWMTHIGGYPENYSPRVRRGLAIKAPQIFICGHSHILKVLRDPRYNNMLVLNPGAAGTHGFHLVKTILRFTLDNGKIPQMEAIELGKRGAIPQEMSAEKG